MKVITPKVFDFYCRGCVDITPHFSEGEYIYCWLCEHRTLGYEVLCTYSYDDETSPAVLLPPVPLETRASLSPEEEALLI